MRAAGRRSRGVALLLALLVVAVLAAAVFPFLYDGRVERAVASNLYTGLQASRLASSGVVLAEALLEADQERSHDSYDDLWARLNDVPVAAAGGIVAVRVTDESGKLNVNQLVRGGSQGQQQAGQINEEWLSVLRRLLVLLERDEQTADAMLEALADWIDRDQRPISFNSAERPYYLGLTPPYEPADRPLETVSELRAVRGWEDPKLFSRVAPFLTTLGTTKINCNTASEQVLRALGLDETQARAVVERRERAPFESEAACRDAIPGRGTSNLPWAGVQSRYFSVSSTATFRDSIAVVRAVVARDGNRISRLFWRAE